MKVIAYKLTDEGKIPEYVIDGGYFYKGDTLIGVAEDTAPEAAIATKADLQNYAKTIEPPKTLHGENPTITDLVNNWWTTKVTW